MGDKTQISTVLFATDGERNPWMVFAAASSALIVSTAIAVLLGTFARCLQSPAPCLTIS
ncbi:MAG: hypothetical protein COA47_12465 [Robiginitomaculum sp.]|nr:MAG: hypothetical protein COA47_12465 [Robiginitomaculum sp.]